MTTEDLENKKYEQRVLIDKLRKNIHDQRLLLSNLELALDTRLKEYSKLCDEADNKRNKI